MERVVQWLRGVLGGGSRLGYLGLMAWAVGSMPVAQPFAYVSNYSDGTVSVIDTATNTLVATVTVKGHPDKIAITPDGAYAYIIGDVDPGFVWIIDTATNTVVDTLEVGRRPTGVAITPDGVFAYVTNYDVHTISVIDTASHTVATIVGIPYPTGVAITPDGAFAYVTSYTGPIFVIDTASYTVVATIAVSTNQRSHRVAITPDGAFAYVITTNTVAVVDTATRTQIAAVPLIGKPNPWELAIPPGGLYVYLSTSVSIWVFDTASHAVVDRVRIDRPYGMAFTPDGTWLYVTHPQLNSISVLDPTTDTVVAMIAGEGSPGAIAMTP